MSPSITSSKHCKYVKYRYVTRVKCVHVLRTSVFIYRTDEFWIYLLSFWSRVRIQLTAFIWNFVTTNSPVFCGKVDGWSRSYWPRGLWRRSTAARLLRLWVRIASGEAWMSVCRECCVLSGSGLCEGLISRPEESYRLWCVVMLI